MPDPFIVMTGVVTAVACVVCYRWGKKNGRIAGYYEGRLKGYKACENLILERGAKLGYDEAKLWEDLIQ